MDNMPEEKVVSVPSGSSVIDVLIVLAKRKKMIIVTTIVVAIASIAMTLLMTKTYIAAAKILPPQQAQSGAAALLAQLGGVAGAAAGAAGIKNPNDMYVGMLKSRTIADKIIARFDLKNVYRKTTFDMTRKELSLRTMINAGRDGLIEIQVEDESPERAAAIANGYTEELLKLTKVLAVTEASQRRLFFERQLAASKDNLAQAESTLKAAFAKSGVVSVDAESRTLVEIAAKLRAQIAAKEIALASMSKFFTTNSQEYKRAENELSSMKVEFSRLENGRLDGSGSGGGKSDGLESIKILREVKYHQMLYELLSKQYEVARLDEAKDSSIIQVLDKAQPPELKAKPKRAVIVVICTAIGFIFSLFWAMFSEARERALQIPEQAQKIQLLRSYLRIR